MPFSPVPSSGGSSGGGDLTLTGGFSAPGTMGSADILPAGAPAAQPKTLTMFTQGSVIIAQYIFASGFTYGYRQYGASVNTNTNVTPIGGGFTYGPYGPFNEGDSVYYAVTF